MLEYYCLCCVCRSLLSILEEYGDEDFESLDLDFSVGVLQMVNKWPHLSSFWSTDRFISVLKAVISLFFLNRSAGMGQTLTLIPQTLKKPWQVKTSKDHGSSCDNLIICDIVDYNQEEACKKRKKK